MPQSSHSPSPPAPLGDAPADPAERRLVRVAIWCFVAATVLRLAAVLLIEWRPWFDDKFYFEKATEIAAGQGYFYLDHPTAFFPVGYPGTLALLFRLTGPSLLAAQLLNVVFSMATVATVYALTARLASRRTAVVALVLFGFLPNQILSTVVTMSELTFTFALTLGLLACLRENWHRAQAWGLVVGVVFGWATLVRPQALFVPFIALPLIAVFRVRARLLSAQTLTRLVTVGLGMALVIGPWTYRNHRVFGKFVLVSTNGGENLLIGNNPQASGRFSAPGQFFPAGVDIEALHELERDRIGGQLAKEYLRAHPVQALARVPKKIWYMYRSDLGVANWILQAHGLSGTRFYLLASAFIQGFYLLVLVGGFAWLAIRLVNRPRSPGEQTLLSLAVAVIAYFTLISAVFFGDARFHQPLMPLLSAAAAALGVELHRRWQLRRQQRAAPAAHSM